VSLRDADGKELALVEDPRLLDEDSRVALETALRETAFVFEVTRIVVVDEEVEIRTWTVQTRQGLRRFQTARDAWPRELPTGDYLVRDVAGDLYRIGDPEGLDAESRRYLWAFVE
jgi:3-polyprenyl-4-hydroxybenzoate decarboxylase